MTSGLGAPPAPAQGLPELTLRGWWCAHPQAGLPTAVVLVGRTQLPAGVAPPGPLPRPPLLRAPQICPRLPRALLPLLHLWTRMGRALSRGQAVPIISPM